MERFPPEILCNIFLAALPHPTDPDEYLPSIVAPLHISHVCRSWRTLSLSFRELWSYLCISYSPRRTDLKATVSVFDAWIKRTRGAPLNFRIKLFSSPYEDTAIHRDAEYIITTMISQQHRWRDVAFTWWDVELSPEFPGLSLTNMPLLTSLALDVMLPPRAKISIAQSPRLRRLFILATNFDLVTGDEPLYSFTESAEIGFRYGGCSEDHALRIWLDVLKAAPFLTEFITDFSCLSPPRALIESLIRLPNLRTLNLKHDPASFIIDHLTIPNLQVLCFTTNGSDRDVKAKRLTNFIRRSLPPLTTLVMVWCTAHDGLVITILRLLPTLKYLRIDLAQMRRRFFHELTVPSSNGTDSLPGDEYATVCPVLETLFLQDVYFEEDADSWVAFIAMLKSRPRGLGKSNVIYLRRGIGAPIAVELSELSGGIGDSRREVRDHFGWTGMVIGNYEAVESLLI